MDLLVCSNCGRRPLVDARPPSFNAASWCCDTCNEHPARLSAANHMNPAPQGRPLAVWKAKRDTIAHCGDDISWLPPMPPPAAHYPPVYYEATLAETLLVTRFRTVMSIRHMPLYHKKYRGHTIAFMQDLSDFVGRVSVPIRFDTLAFWIVRVQHDQGRKHQDYRVRKAVVIELLKWLPMLLTDAYSDVSWPMRENIDEEQLNRLPDDDYIYDVLPHSLYDNDDAGGGSSASATGPMMAEYVSGAEMDMDSSGFVGRPPAETNSAAAGRAVETMGGRAVGAKPLPWATARSQRSASGRRATWCAPSRSALR